MTNTLTINSPLKGEHRSLIFVLLILAVIYFPFANKAFIVDDTLFLKAAEQILVKPIDFYGGEVNWYGYPAPQYLINKNPPLVSYLIAGVASVFGFNELPLHMFFFLSIALSAVGIYLLGRQFNADPLLTTILATFTPVFLVHGTNLMSDSTMLMFWIWGLVFWMNGIKTDAPKWFLLAGLSVGFGVLTKYTGIFLLPLMVFSGLWHYRKPGWWLLAVLIPLLAIVGFDYYTQVLYGRGLFREAFIYAHVQTSKNLVDYFDNTLIGLSFLGGCFPVALLLVPLSGGRLLRVLASVFAVGIFALIFSRGQVGSHMFINNGVTSTYLMIQFCTFVFAGVCVVLACLKELTKGLDHDSVFLLLWFLGVFTFVCYLNWTINARSFILLAPVVGILLSRRLEQWAAKSRNLKNRVSYALMGIAGLITITITYADYAWANTARLAAKEISSKYKTADKVFFQGHWGFQYYMEKAGAQPVDFGSDDINAGEIVVIPNNNTNLIQPDFRFELVEVMAFENNSFVVTMSPAANAGFYSSGWGPVAYSFESPDKEIYRVFRKK